MRRPGRLAALFLLLPLLAFGPGDRIAPTRWALVVGISDYLHFDDVVGGDLPGAEHDARAMRDALVGRWGFPEDQVRTLLNGAATRAAIEEGVTGWLAGNARPGDNVVIFFAGHGAQMWDEDGDEDDGLDETLAPADVSPTDTGRDISDDTFAEWLRTIPTTNVVVILDNCSSGTGTRDLTPFSRARRLGRDIHGIERPEGVATRALAEEPDESGFEAGGTPVLELAAAQPDQAAVDAYFPGGAGAEPFHGGAFTTFLVRALWRAPTDASYEEVFEDVAQALKRNRFRQDPHLSVDVSLKDEPLFFVEGGGPGGADASLSVRSVSQGVAELGGGQTLGITAGSVFETAGGARLVVESVSREASRARIQSGAVAVGEAAALVGYRYPALPLLVGTAGVDSSTIAALVAALGENPTVQLVPDEEAFSHLLVRRRDDDVRVVGADGFVRHEGLVPGDGRALAAVLRREAAAKSLADLDNPTGPFRVRVRMEGDKASFGIGEKVSFHVTSEREGYLTLVDLGTDGKVVLLFPNEHQPAMRIEAGQTLSFPTADMDFELQVFPPAGRGMVRAFVTPEPLDVPMSGEYPEGDERFAEIVARAVARAAGSVEGAVRLDTWATASLVYDIHD